MLHKTIVFHTKTPVFKTFYKDLCFVLIVLLVFLGSADIFSLQGSFFFASFLLMVTWIILNGTIVFDLGLGISVLFSVCYCLSLWKEQGFTFATFISIFLFFPIVYEFGVVLAEEKKPLKNLFYLVISNVSGLFVSSFFTILATIMHEGLQIDGGVLFNFWSNDYVSRTGLSLYQIGFIELSLCVLFIKDGKWKWYSFFLFLLSFAFCLWAGLTAGNRAIVAVVAMLFFGWIAYAVYKVKKPIIKFSIVSFVVLLGLYLVALRLRVLPTPSFLSSIPAFQRIMDGGSDSERLLLYRQFFSNFYRFPFGGVYLAMKEPYVHNLWLDFYTYGGVIPFLCASFFFISYAITFAKWAKRPFEHQIEKAILLSVPLSYFALGLFEPIFQANNYCLFSSFIVLIVLRAILIQKSPNFDLLTSASISI